ncbi:uncharacterized protein LOC120264934 [Dioscorea cayenensis subsp. rotundata]|uniref:Uncharacterized protein LOC120264934 n=1 Tax=Dioscorea cayennensis subsp. rotundata TaxID=55577 RepID=A0AB40BNN5_DIOCR|nr:uncharacterized protein LOC120264934 [Dioscorea cayenensis subsp. rotundata]XP_039128767.1 uncharacterized protein LOC120264934 [Dioscorea cayenensis subsp. rotundata]XP_039128768.1 uncharacterized protein LOC120264934 [Dioscorea cayenensis subsp. rotundata]XP_039128769.1 uncharacterized protein LOC120264934 [Dioscorea cayenensis subsp. rotundata]XP_039128770.1 uncharacterized protein LOC120264934 [Dioscorea cayenensis subsp. rotundata]XP_039128771.1 uncharacterized protein LOC120264934 [Di
MSIDFNHISLKDQILDNQWDNFSINNIFGGVIDIANVSLAKVDFDSGNHWVWQPKTNCHKISSAVYHFFNNESSYADRWNGWNVLWHIPVAPRVKYFIWLCLHGHLTTAVLLHQLNLGPDSVCIFCGMQRETVDHLFGGCANTQQAIARVKEFSSNPSDPIGKKLILLNFCPANGHFIFTHAISNISTQEVAFQSALDSWIRVRHIFTDHININEILESPIHYLNWQFHDQISSLNVLMDMLNRPKIHKVPSAWMSPVINIASLSFQHLHLNLFLVGRDLPYWIMLSFYSNGFTF